MKSGSVKSGIIAPDCTPILEVQKANARLIAAAPGLLEAAIKTVEENRHLADGENCTLIYLKRAIAEATIKTAE